MAHWSTGNFADVLKGFEAEDDLDSMEEDISSFHKDAAHVVAFSGSSDDVLESVLGCSASENETFYSEAGNSSPFHDYEDDLGDDSDSDEDDLEDDLDLDGDVSLENF